MVYVFRTSVKSETDIRKLAPYLDELLLPSVWNFDLDDCDKILRVDSPEEISEAIITLLLVTGFDCEELE